MSCQLCLVIGLSATQTRNRDFWRVQETETRYPIAPEKNLEVTKFDKQKNFNYKIQPHIIKLRYIQVHVINIDKRTLVQ